MAIYPITLNLPEITYKQIQLVAAKFQRPIGEILVEAATALAPASESVDSNLVSDLAHLALLNDAALWQAARSTMPQEHKERLESLHDKQQREGLTKDEEEEEQTLLKLYRETLLVRAQAAVLLNQRNYDVSDPSQFQPVM